MIHSILQHEPIQTAVDRMVEHRIGSLIVYDATGNVMGIVTERDVLRAMARRECDMAGRNVADIMTRDMVVAGPHETVHELCKLMTRNRVRHLPIVHEGRLEGLVSLGDLVIAELEEALDENHQLKDYIVQAR